MRWPSKPGSTFPAVEWTTIPRRPQLDLPSSLPIMLSGILIFSEIDARTNSPGWMIKGSSALSVNSMMLSGMPSFGSMWVCSDFLKTLNAVPRLRSIEHGPTESSLKGCIRILLLSIAFKRSLSDRTVMRDGRMGGF